MTKVDFFGHWFYFFLFVGMLLIHAKDFRGWIFRFAGEIGWIGIGLVMGMSSIWAWGFAFLIVDAMGYTKWKQEEQERIDWDNENQPWLAVAKEQLASIEDNLFGEVGGPDCTKEEHQPFCREYEKEKKNGKEPVKRSKPASAKRSKNSSTPKKRNTPRKRQAKGKKVAARSGKASNRKVRPARGRSGK